VSAAALLDRLHIVRQTAPGRWLACCPAHDDRRPSLGIRQLDDGRVLLHCFAECSTEEVLRAVGLTFEALYPKHAISDCVHPEQRPFPAIDALRCVAFESLIAAVAAANIASGNDLSAADRVRLRLAARRLQSAVEAVRA
jgi:hypothetical protein